MTSPLLKQISKKKTRTYSIDEAVLFLKEYFEALGYGGRKKFCETHKQIKYGTLNSITNHKPNSKKKQPLPYRKIALLFKTVGYECTLVKTIEFHITEK